MSKNPFADELIQFLNESPTPYHAVRAISSRLTKAGVPILYESETWKLGPGGSTFVIRNDSSLFAVRVPSNFNPLHPLPFHIVAAHTDSPGLRFRPFPMLPSEGYRQWGIEVYGGTLYNSWLDRDLGIAGRIYRIGTSPTMPKLIRFENTPIRIPQLAIHLDRSVNEQGVVLNPHRHLVPILGMAQGTSLESMLTTETGIPFSEMVFDLCLYDLNPAGYGGLDNDFVYSGRLDNLAMTHAAVAAFLDAPAQEAIQVLALFDHEEVGSVSTQGADSNFLTASLERIANALGMSRETWLVLMSRSFLISADMAHALHPNYPEKHDPTSFPILNQGIVLKSNSSMRYATDASTASRLIGFARNAGSKIQHFVNRADLGCGTTVGPGLSAQLGIPTVDIGNAMLSMHSIREMCGSEDHGMMIATLREFFRG